MLHRPDDYCQPFIVKRDPVVGRFFFFPPFTIIYDFKYAGSDVWIRVARYTVASRDIPACQLILREEPAVHGPYTKTTPVCLSCYAKVIFFEWIINDGSEDIGCPWSEGFTPRQSCCVFVMGNRLVIGYIPMQAL